MAHAESQTGFDEPTMANDVMEPLGEANLIE
jgi:hypothetical protein